MELAFHCSSRVSGSGDASPSTRVPRNYNVECKLSTCAMPTYNGSREDILRAWQLKESEGAQTCFVLLSKKDMANTTVQETTVVSIHTSLASAKEAERVTWGDEVLLYEFVMDPPILQNNYGGKNVANTSSPDWMMDSMWVFKE